jgi:trigger factor
MSTKPQDDQASESVAPAAEDAEPVTEGADTRDAVDADTQEAAADVTAEQPVLEDPPAEADSEIDTALPDANATVDREGVRVNMTIEVPADAVAKQVQEVAQVFRERARIPGFRRGKAPMGMVRQRYKEEIREHVLDQMIPQYVSAELRSRDLEPIHTPLLDNVEFDVDRHLLFTVHFDVTPDIEVDGYKGLRASRTEPEVGEEAVEKALSDLRERAAKVEPVDDDSGAALNDFVAVSISLFPKDGKGKRLAEEERYVHLGNEQAIPGLNSQLEGLKAGDTREFVTRLGDTYPNDLLAGKEVTCRVDVTDVKRRHLPAVDDELAKDLGLESLDELREKVRQDITEQMEQEADSDVIRQLLDQVLEANPFEAPESMIEARLDRVVQRAAEDIARQGMDPREGVDWARFRADNRIPAERAVKEELVLDEIVKAESLAVDDDAVLAEIERMQGGSEASTAAIAAQMRKEGSFDAMRRMMARQGALEYLKSHATIESVAGSPTIITEDSSA